MKQSLAIIGTGIAGMACGHYLHEKFDITVYEENDYVGGHTNTITTEHHGAVRHIDTGFMVFNNVTYPNFTKLLNELGVESQKTSMSFSVQHVPSKLEYNGSGLNGLFAQRKNIFNPKFIRMLLQISRFNTQSVKILDEPHFQDYTLGRYIDEMGFGDDMFWKYLVPMSSAVWSTPMDLMLKFPAVALIRFFKNHGFLGLNTQHQWYTVKGGSKSYRDKIIEPYKDKILLNNAVVKVTRRDNGVFVLSKDGIERKFDKVIFACHADEALQLIDKPTMLETRLLSRFKYQENIATLHTDETIMPKLKRVWSSWNYRIEEKRSAGGKGPKAIYPSTIYWMNSLHGFHTHHTNYFVSINDPENVHENKVIKRIAYKHPLFDVEAMKAQMDLPLLNKQQGGLYFCGSYFKYGFHEDALVSSLDLIKHLSF